MVWGGPENQAETGILPVTQLHEFCVFITCGVGFEHRPKQARCLFHRLKLWA
jgi:hypothetical protein